VVGFAGDDHRPSPRSPARGPWPSSALLAAHVLGRAGDSGAVPCASGPPPATIAADSPPKQASPTPAATPSPAPPRGLALIETAPGAFESVIYGNGQAIDWIYGIFFMDTANGAIRGYRLTAGDDYGTLATSPDAGLVVGSANNETFLLDRATGASWRWPGLLLRLLAASRRRLLFAQAEPDTNGRPLPHGRFFLVDRDLDPASVIEFELPLPPNPRGLRPLWQQRGGSSAVLQDAGAAFILLEDEDRTSLHLWRVDRFGAAERLGGDTLAIDGYVRQGVRMEVIGGGREVLLVAHFVPSDGVGDPAAPLRFVNRRFSWFGNEFAFEDAGGRGLDLAPEGDLIAWQEELHEPVEAGFRAFGGWPAVVVADAATGEPHFRVRSAFLVYGDGLPRRRWWSAGRGRGLIVGVLDEAVAGGAPSRDAISYRSVLPGPQPSLGGDFGGPDLGSEWYHRRRTMGPVPAPQGLGVSYGRLAYTDRGSAFQANIDPESGGPTHRDPWGAQSEEMVFALGHGGHGGGSLGVLLRPRIELPPFSDAMAFVVARTDSSLNVRSEPSLEAEILANLLDGSRAELADRPDGDPSATFEPGSTSPRLWVHVRAEDGAEGWVDSAFLDWA